MEIFNNTRNIDTRQTTVNSRTRTKKSKSSSSSSSDAVRVFIDPRTLASTEYKLILKEENSFPIYNPRVLQYDEHLKLQFYEKM